MQLRNSNLVMHGFQEMPQLLREEIGTKLAAARLKHKSKNKKASFPHQYGSALEISDRAVLVQECVSRVYQDSQGSGGLTNIWVLLCISSLCDTLYCRNKQINKNPKIKRQNKILHIFVHVCLWEHWGLNTEVLYH